MGKIIADFACTVCGCVCDDLRLTVEGERIVRAEGACRLSEPWLLSQGEQRPPHAEIEGRSVPVAEALDRAAALLRGARSPLVYGLSRSSTEGQQAAVALADQLGATIDTTASLGHAPSVMALQEAGESTCTLGEVKNRADLVVFWGSDPVASHPRHLERYSGEAIGEWIPHGRPDRALVVVDIVPTETSARADVFIRVPPDGDFEVLSVLRGLVQGRAFDGLVEVQGVPLSVLTDLAARMRACRFGIVFFGLGLSRRRLGHRTVEALLRLTSELNQHTRFYARRMRVSGDVAGADSVLAWQTGYPFSVNLARGYPRFNPGEFTAQTMLERNEVDACVLVGSQGVRRLSPLAVERLRAIPTVVLDGPSQPSLIPPTVRFTTATYGIHRPGTVYRMDEVPIPLKAALPCDYESDREVLEALRQRLAIFKP
jgi:formylmethanofuran dehydrogenase subunit B